MVHQEPLWREELPVELRTMVSRANWETVTIGRSGMRVFRGGDGYLKIARQEPAASIGGLLALQIVMRI